MDKRPLKIVGCGGHGRVLADIARASGQPFDGFIDDDPSSRASGRAAGPVVEVLPRVVHSHRIVVGIGESATRRRLAEQIIAQGGTLATLVHPAAVIAPDVAIGVGTVIMAGVVINTGTRIGSFAIINTRASVDHDNVIGDNVMIGPGCVLAGGVIVRRDAFVAAGATIIPGVEIGAGAYVAAGAVVTKRVPAGTLVAGCPAVVKRAAARGI